MRCAAHWQLSYGHCPPVSSPHFSHQTRIRTARALAAGAQPAAAANPAASAPAAAAAPHEPDLSPLLSDDRFHRALFAVCAELVTASTSPVGFPFPASAVAVGLRPLDVCAVMESVVRADPTLPRELKRHLNACHEQVLELLAFERGSSLYDLLVQARGPLPGAPPRAAVGVCGVCWAHQVDRTLSMILPSLTFCCLRPPLSLSQRCQRAPQAPALLERPLLPRPLLRSSRRAARLPMPTLLPVQRRRRRPASPPLGAPWGARPAAPPRRGSGVLSPR